MPRLIELNPRWYIAADSPDILGITFDCPCCKVIRLGVPFVEVIDRDGLPDDVHWGRPGVKWNRSGETFETLSLSPSIDASAFGHWHGHISSGEVTS
jgi:hypothetical protein